MRAARGTAIAAPGLAFAYAWGSGRSDAGNEIVIKLALRNDADLKRGAGDRPLP